MSFIGNQILKTIEWINQNATDYKNTLLIDSEDSIDCNSQKQLETNIKVVSAIDNIIFAIGNDIEQHDEYWEDRFSEDIYNKSYEAVLTKEIAINLNTLWNKFTQQAKDLYIVHYLSLNHEIYFTENPYLYHEYQDYMMDYNVTSPIESLPNPLKKKLILQKFYYLAQEIKNNKEINPYILHQITTNILNNLLKYDYKIEWSIFNILKTKKSNIDLQKYLIVYYFYKVKKIDYIKYFVKPWNGFPNEKRHYKEDRTGRKKAGIIDIIENNLSI
jgi:hypothetical protein